MPQPNYIALRYQNVYTLSGNNITDYYYNDGKIYLDGQENLGEVKELTLTAEQTNRITRLKRRDTLNSSATGVYTTPEGINIPYNRNDEIFVAHNYVDSDNIDRDPNSSTVRNSWWYDTNFHRSYKIYLVVRYTRFSDIGTNRYYDWRLADTYIAYKDATANNTDGAYIFGSNPPQDVQFSGSVLFETPRGFNTWKSASLNVYKNDVLHTSSLLTDPTVTVDRLDVNFNIPSAQITIGDRWRMSVEVDGPITDIQDPLQVPQYTMSMVTPIPPLERSFLGFVTPNDIINFVDCQPTLNNANNLRQSLFVQDVDYSTGISLPQNIDLIDSNDAIRAATPDSNYSQYSHTLIRYFGVKTNRENFNTGSVVVFDPNVPQNSSPYSFTTDNLGAVPNVELLNYYIGYFNRIVDPYPLLNNKTAYFVQYIVDVNRDLYDPSIEDDNFTNLKSVFRVSDIDGKPTNAKASVISKNDFDELKELEEFKPVFKVGEFPTPIAYSQTSSVDYTGSIKFTNGRDFVSGTAPYWEYTSAGSKYIYLVPQSLNNIYNGEYLMDDLPYSQSRNVNFPFNTEPSFVKFPTVTEKFNIKVGDEIRFENDENKVFRIESSSFQTISGQSSLVLELDKQIPTSVNKDFFVIRRYKPISNYVILNQQKPYGIPAAQNSTEGILSPQYKLPTLNIQADEISALLQNQSLTNNITINNIIPTQSQDITTRYKVKECGSTEGSRTEYIIDSPNVVLGNAFLITSGDSETYYEAYKNVTDAPNTTIASQIYNDCASKPAPPVPDPTFTCTTAGLRAEVDSSGNVTAEVNNGTLTTYSPTSVPLNGDTYTITGQINIPTGYANYPGAITCTTQVATVNPDPGCINGITATQPSPFSLGLGDSRIFDLNSLASGWTNATVVSERLVEANIVGNTLTITATGCNDLFDNTGQVFVDLTNPGANYCLVRLYFNDISITGCPTTPTDPEFTCDDWTGDVQILEDGTVTITNGNATNVTSNPSSFLPIAVDTSRDLTLTITVPAGYSNSGETIECPKTVTQPGDPTAPRCLTWVVGFSKSDPGSSFVEVTYRDCDNNLQTVNEVITQFGSVRIEICGFESPTKDNRINGPADLEVRTTADVTYSVSFQGEGDCPVR